MNCRWLYTFLFLYLFLNLNATNIVLQDLNYSDGLEPLENPDIGFYRTQVLHLKPEGNRPTSTWGNISHLRVDISEFSDKAVLSIDETTGDTTFGKAQSLTQDALDAFEATLDEIRKRGKSAIVRFSYDPYFNGAANCDPAQPVILNHLKQIGKVYARNTDVITFVELGMYGSWGEMHTSNVGSNENIAEALQTLLTCTPPEIKIGVRRPDIVAYWLGVNDGSNYSGFDIYAEKFKKAKDAKGDTIYRVGMYNDGYLGSNSDLGTVGMGQSGHQLTREMMVQWLEEYSQHTPYGGELVANYNGDHPINTPIYLSQEGFKTHTSYLNYEWHQATILGWKDTIFSGTDPEYFGKDGFTYVENHLGYRYILRSSLLPDTIENFSSTIDLSFSIENVGFGNLTSNKKVSFLFMNDDYVHEILPDTYIDPREWKSQQLTEIKTTLTVPNINQGYYDVLLRISDYANYENDNNFHCIQLGNPSEQFVSKYGANLIGKLYVNHHVITSVNELENDKDNWLFIENKTLHIHEGESLFLYNVKGELIFRREGIFKDFNLELSAWGCSILICKVVCKGEIKVFKIVL